ncbi:MAG: ligase [Phycisphaerales bacterium]|nr:ligase [Phycisphaerales bacterium]
MPATLDRLDAPAARPRPAVTLYYRADGSDKVYAAAVEPRGGSGRYAVTFAFGRRGSALQPGTKTPIPVPLAEANRVFDRLVSEKTAKGYTPAGPAASSFAGTGHAGRATGVLPQLLTPIDESDVDGLVADPDWWVQPKLDGRRTLIRKDADEVVGINRSGLTVPLPAPVAAAVGQLWADRCLLDGELVGGVYHAFDLIDADGDDVRPAPYARRYDGLLDLVDAVPADALRYVDTATTPARKRELVDRLRAQNAEGVVFKHRLAAYTPGRPATGGPQRKLKFWASASCVVARPSRGRRSVELELSHAGRAVPIGRVTVPAGQPVPPAGAVVEVRYLYAFPGGSLYQPVYLGARDDVGPDACTTAQLKLRPAGGDSDDDPAASR